MAQSLLDFKNASLQRYGPCDDGDGSTPHRFIWNVGPAGGLKCIVAVPEVDALVQNLLVLLWRGLPGWHAWQNAARKE